MGERHSIAPAFPPPREGVPVLSSHHSSSRTWRRAVKTPAVALEARAEAMVREKLGREKD